MFRPSQAGLRVIVGLHLVLVVAATSDIWRHLMLLALLLVAAGAKHFHYAAEWMQAAVVVDVASHGAAGVGGSRGVTRCRGVT